MEGIEKCLAKRTKSFVVDESNNFERRLSRELQLYVLLEEDC